MLNLSSAHYENRKLENHVENRTVHTLKNAELNIFETHLQASQVYLRFPQPVLASMIKGKKVMHLDGSPAFGFLPGESVILPSNEKMVIDFPEASVSNPTQCLALALSEEKLQEAVDLLNNRGTKQNGLEWSVMEADDAFLDKAIEGAVLFALNQGEVCTCPSRLLIHESIYDKFIERVIGRVKAIKVGNPLDPTVMMGAQASQIQKDKILSYINLGKEEGAELLCGGDVNHLGGDLEGGYYIQPTLFKGHNKMRIFQEEIFGPVLAVTTFKTTEEALEIANDTLYGLGAGVWTRDAHELYTVPRAIQAGRVWVNQYHAYPAGAPFGGYKQSGIGRENHKMMLGHYRQSKNMLISYNKNKLGFF